MGGGTSYGNGRVPLHLLKKHGEHYFFPGTFARWVGFQRDVHDETGVWLYITPGPNAYRSYDDQDRMRRELGVQAAIPGRSSHGGLWTGQTKGHSGLPTWVENRESGALDIGNWASVPWEVFERLARKWGFIPDIVVPTEKWHLVDLDPWGHNLEDDMPTANEIAAAVWNYAIGQDATKGKQNQPAWRRLSWAHADGARLVRELLAAFKDPDGRSGTLLNRIGWMDKRLRESEAREKGFEAAIKALAGAQGIDPEVIQSTVDAAVRDALKNIEITLTTQDE